MQPLGPGFRFTDRQTEIHVLPAPSASLHVRVEDHLQNAGDRALRSLEVRLPEGPAFGAPSIRVKVEGREVTPAHHSESDRRLVRMPFDPVWEKQQSREIVAEWNLQLDRAGRGTVGVSENAFYVADATALPLWQAPPGIFTKGGPDPARESLTVVAPADFKVLAPGKPLRTSAHGDMVAHRFLVQPAKDYLPFVVAGRYQEEIISASGTSVIFWTFQPVEAAAKAAAARLAASVSAFADYFGPVEKDKTPIRIVEAPGEFSPEFDTQGGLGSASFPGGVLLDHRAFEQGLSQEAVLQLAEYALARTWFGWRVRPRPETQILLGRGLGLFGLMVAAEARGDAARRAMVALLIERYDQARSVAVDRYLLEPPVGYSRAERISTGYRAALFFVALEDLCGRAALQAGFHQLLRTSGHDEIADEELRSAVEFSSHRDLAEMFRTWLNRPGIPDEFRARYVRSSPQ